MGDMTDYNIHICVYMCVDTIEHLWWIASIAYYTSRSDDRHISSWSVHRCRQGPAFAGLRTSEDTIPKEGAGSVYLFVASFLEPSTHKFRSSQVADRWQGLEQTRTPQKRKTCTSGPTCRHTWSAHRCLDAPGSRTEYSPRKNTS